MFREVLQLPQNASIKDFIIDSEDDEPLIGASIKIIGQNIGSVTDLSGNFKI